MDQNAKHSRALHVASEAARVAGAHIMQELPHIKPDDVKEKGPGDFVTQVDHTAERLIKERILKDFPNDAILSEEAGGGIPDAAELWVVDPLDGTSNFIHHFPLFCVSIAFTLNRRAEVAAVYDPVHDELFTGKRNEGAWLNDTPIAVSPCRDLSKAFIATGFPSRYKEEADNYVRQFRNISGAVAGIRRGGSAALDLAYVACGRFDGFWEPRLSPWDMAAGVLLINAAGGITTDERGHPWGLSSRGIIAGNPDIHPHLVRLLTAHVPIERRNRRGG